MAARTSAKMLIPAVAALLAGVSASATAQNAAAVDRLYAFGDSYSDGGNAYALTRRPTSPPYVSRYSDGMTAVEYMAKGFGLTLRYSEDVNLSAEASLNFAVGGAWTSRRNNDAALDGKTGLLSQVADFERRLKSGEASFGADTTLFFIAAGINDVLAGNVGGQDNAALVTGALQNVEEAVRSLHAAGARHVAIATLPMVNLAPRAASLPAPTAKAIGDAVVSLNQGYQRMAGKLRTDLRGGCVYASVGTVLR